MLGSHPARRVDRASTVGFPARHARYRSAVTGRGGGSERLIAAPETSAGAEVPSGYCLQSRSPLRLERASRVDGAVLGT